MALTRGALTRVPDKKEGTSYRNNPPYERKDLLKLFIYGYFNKIRSSRSLETECKRNIELMWLVNGIRPDHGTISLFLKENRKGFKR
ncbi:transposase [Virgibacillus alimentarius]|uniref:transposase n=1 Tax=Virgibacillus alimentarius TaxID=698769 RepID=UPI0036282A79